MNKIKSLVKTKKLKHNGKDAITHEMLSGIYFELHPGIDEIHDDYHELHNIAESLGLSVVFATQLNRPAGDAYAAI